MGGHSVGAGSQTGTEDEAFAGHRAAGATVKARVTLIVHRRPAAIIPIVIRLEQASGRWILPPLKSSHWVSDEQRAMGLRTLMQ